MDSVVDFQGTAASTLIPLSDSLVAASQPYVGQWSRLVSTTNWEKGRIIVEWREALVSQGLPVAEYSDEAWGRLVGGVTGQHVGRLRRIFASTPENHTPLAAPCVVLSAHEKNLGRLLQSHLLRGRL